MTTVMLVMVAYAVAPITIAAIPDVVKSMYQSIILPYDRILNRRFNKKNNSMDRRFGIGSRTFYFLTFRIKKNETVIEKIDECHASAKCYLRLLSNFQTTYFVHIG